MFFQGWTKQKLIGFSSLIALVILFAFISLNIGSGPHKEARGTVTSIGVDTTSKFELPHPLITVTLENNAVINVEAPRNLSISVGDRVIVTQSTRYLTSGHEYQFKRLEE